MNLRSLFQKKEAPKPKTINDSYTVSQRNPRNIYSLYTSEFSSLNANQLKFYFESARKGLNFWKSLLFDEIRRRDAHIGAVCQTRKLAILSSPFVIKSENENDKKLIEDVFNDFNFQNFITDCVEASIQGLSMFEINWHYAEGLGTIPSEIIMLPNHLVMYDDKTSDYKLLDIELADYNEIRAIASNQIQDAIDVNQLPRVDINPLKLLEVHSFDGNSVNGLLNGCIDTLIWIYFFKSYGIKDWASYIERYAMPLRVGKYDPMMGAAEKASLLDAVQNIAHNSYAIHPNTAEINFVNDPGAGNSAELFGKYSSYWNEQISIRVLGQTLTTQLENTGSFAAAKVHDNVRRDILVSDMKLVTSAVNGLIKRIADLNGMQDYPVFEFTEATNLENLKLKSEIYINLQNLGFTVAPDQIEKEFEIELDKEEPKEKTPPKFSEETEADQEIENIINEIWHTQKK